MFEAPLYDYHGERLPMKEIAQRSGTKADTIHTRMQKHGLTAQEAADMPPLKNFKHDYHGGKATITSVSMQTGISRIALYRRMKRCGCTLEEAVAMGPDLRFKKPKPAVRPGVRGNALKIFAALFCGEKPTEDQVQAYADEMNFREDEPGVFRFESETYDFRIAAEESAAELTAVVRRTGKTSIRRFYTIDKGGNYHERH